MGALYEKGLRLENCIRLEGGGKEKQKKVKREMLKDLRGGTYRKPEALVQDRQAFVGGIYFETCLRTEKYK